MVDVVCQHVVVGPEPKGIDRELSHVSSKCCTYFTEYSKFFLQNINNIVADWSSLSIPLPEPGLTRVPLHQDDLGVRELAEDDVPQCTGWLVHHYINILVNLMEDLRSLSPLKKVNVMLQIEL